MNYLQEYTATEISTLQNKLIEYFAGKPLIIVRGSNKPKHEVCFSFTVLDQHLQFHWGDVHKSDFVEFPAYFINAELIHNESSSVIGERSIWKYFMLNESGDCFGVVWDENENEKLIKL